MGSPLGTYNRSGMESQRLKGLRSKFSAKEIGSLLSNKVMEGYNAGYWGL